MTQNSLLCINKHVYAKSCSLLKLRIVNKYMLHTCIKLLHVPTKSNFTLQYFWSWDTIKNCGQIYKKKKMLPKDIGSIF